ncbi:hypothetical protein HDU85_004532 [Gaertneriomyces sp. JEL0708]|nr:hypothetical protein HDU85_004532 [Gaertneriomyces sp. JEL0708]
MSSFRRRQASANPPIPGTRPSTHTQALLTSTGCLPLDTLFGGGIPLGQLLLLKQDQHTAYWRVLMNYFLVQGITSGQSVCVIAESAEQILSGLPGIVEGKAEDANESVDADSTRELGKASLREDEKMRIAWRYQNLSRVGDTMNARHDTAYCHTFDLTKRIEEERLKAAGKRVVLVDVDGWMNEGEMNEAKIYDRLVDVIRGVIEEGGFSLQSTTAPSSLLRIVIPSLGSPSWLPNGSSPSPKLLCRFLYTIRAILKNAAAVCMISIPTTLPQVLTARLCHASDACVSLSSFAGVSNPYDTEYNGFFNYEKRWKVGTCVEREGIPGVGALGFWVRRKRFGIERVGLPAEEEEKGRSQETRRPLVDVKRAHGPGCGTGAESKLDF